MFLGNTTYSWIFIHYSISPRNTFTLNQNSQIHMFCQGLKRFSFKNILKKIKIALSAETCRFDICQLTALTKSNLTLLTAQKFVY